ncbi:ATP synthase F1 subunit delta [Lacinutrix sp.]|uniref:ATP synthase F1 subunit delta n=1 Tax=Lacinutrix sp. TaxID=1937692 RepID=UPI0026261CB7|nr:ATP synthase F1 subunit delta [Lacinutrix sp.]MDG1714996.1 ATP synthase F1 subunit delta [Lacinutrix sp.]
MGGSRAAIRYAKAVLSLAQDQKTTDVVNNDMKLIAKTIAENIELSDVLNSPVVSPSIKKSALLEIFKGINPLTANAIDTLMSNKRIALLPEVAKQYSVLFDKLTGTELATVTTALPLTEDLKVKVLAKVKELTGKEVAVENIIDENILGGFVLRVGDLQYDASILNQLSKLKREFILN